MGNVSAAEPRILARPDHKISRKSIHDNALKVLYRLHRADHRAHLVGGAVRDLLLGRAPKDYDVATDARPTQIRRLFRNSRIIGRRFRLVHVYFRQGTVEVATFRCDPDPQAQNSPADDLLITDDNVYGTAREDAFRRDFTINALFYDIADFSVIDYVGGIVDLDSGMIRVIGDADVRFRVDPVRMLRACELAGRLSFGLEAATQEGIERHAAEIDRAASARLTEEVNQILRCGSAAAAMQWMFDLGLAEILLPEVTSLLEAERRGLGAFTRLFEFFDEHIRRGRGLPEVGLLTSLLLPRVMVECENCRGENGRPANRWQLRQIATETATPFFRRFGLSKQKGEQAVQAILGLQRMRRGRWQDRERVRLSQRAWFDDALFLLEAVAATGGQGGEQLKKWRRVRELRPAPPQKTLTRRRRPGRRRGRRRRARKK